MKKYCKVEIVFSVLATFFVFYNFMSVCSELNEYGVPLLKGMEYIIPSVLSNAMWLGVFLCFYKVIEILNCTNDKKEEIVEDVEVVEDTEEKVEIKDVKPEKKVIATSKMKKDELIELAKQLDIKVGSRDKKDEIISKINGDD